MLEIRLLGQFALRYEGKPVRLASRPAQSLFAYLALTAGRVHRREKLAGMLWPDTTEANSRNYLRAALWRIRKAISTLQSSTVDYLLAEEFTIAFNREAEYWLDAAQLERPELDLGSLISNLSLYQGELLPGFYEDWVTEEREHLHALFEKRITQLLVILEYEKSWHEIPGWADYPIQTWTFGDDLAMVFLAGEVVADYGLRLKRELDATRLWVNAYSNDVAFYVASQRMLPEGGYEVDRSMVYYGQPAPLNQVANLSVPEGNLLVVQAWDPSLLPHIEKAILKANLGLTPSSDGKVIRVPIPPLTEERRKELVKLAKKIAEEIRVHIRNIRRDVLEEIKKAQKASQMTEDEGKKAHDELQKLTDAYITKVDETLKKKEAEITEI